MGNIIRIGGEEELSKLVANKNVFDKIDNYHFMVISDHVKVRRLNKAGAPKSPRYSLAPHLMPNSAVTSMKVHYNDKEYKKAYLEQLTGHSYLITLAAIMHMVKVKRPEVNIVMVCSQNESEAWKYLKIVTEFIEDAFGIKCYSGKKYIKNFAEISADTTDYTANEQFMELIKRITEKEINKELFDNFQKYLDKCFTDVLSGKAKVDG